MAIAERSRAGWRLGFESLEAEVADERELDCALPVPGDIDGVLYAVGPARHDVYGSRNADWNDGDGMVHRLHISGGRVRYRSRFVETAKKRNEDRARARRHATFGTRPPGGRLRRMLRPLPMNTANRNVVVHAGRVLALWDAGRPHAVDPVTLETMGEDSLDGLLSARDAFGANPKLDDRTGELWNIGVRQGARPTLVVYRCPAAGRGEVVAEVPLARAAMIQDFGLTPSSVVVVVPPLALPRVPTALLTGGRSYKDSLRWEPQRQTGIAVIDRRTGACRWAATDACVVLHVAQAFDTEGGVAVDCSVYPDASFLRTSGEVMQGEITTQVYSTLQRFFVPHDGPVTRTAFAPVDQARPVALSESGPNARLYGLSLNPLGGFPGLPSRIDLGTGDVAWAGLGADDFSAVPTAVRLGAGGRTRLLSIVLHADAGRSSVTVFDGDDLTGAPAGQALLPHPVPLGLRSVWVPAGAGAAPGTTPLRGV